MSSTIKTGLSRNTRFSDRAGAPCLSAAGQLETAGDQLSTNLKQISCNTNLKLRTAGRSGIELRAADINRGRLMPEQDNAEYFRMRAQDERLRSQHATDPRAAAAHADMADRYEEMAAQFEANSKLTIVV